MRPSDLLQRPIAFQRIFVTMCGGRVSVALFLSQAHYWSKKTPDGWFWKTQEEWEEETGLMRHPQERARAKLIEMGLLEERDDRAEHKLWFRLNLDRLDELIGEALAETAIAPTEKALAETATTQWPKRPPIDGRNGLPSNIQRLHTETTPPKSRAKPRSESSLAGVKFTEWFKTQLPNGIRLQGDWRKAWAGTYDAMIRLDHRTREDIFAVCTWARQDDFWQKNFLSPNKLRNRNRDGVQYFDVFKEAMKAPKRRPQGAAELKAERAKGEFPLRDNPEYWEPE